MKNIILICSIFITHSLWAKSIAEISRLKGEITVLSPTAKAASKATKGMKLSQDTSVLSGKKSFAIIKFDDGSKLTLGPNSKVIVNKMKDDTDMVDMLVGQIRVEVQKDKKKRKDDKEKFIIKTRSAALGVRGTIFNVNYIPENTVTSLITFKGNVAMAKLPPRTKDNNLKKVLANKDKVKEVKEGKCSGTSNGTEKIYEPLKMAPEQFTKLKMNKELSKENKVSDKEYKKEMEITKKLYKKIAKEEKNAPKKKGWKDGGFVDLNTGVYVPPAGDSKFNKELGIHESKTNIGKVNESGDFKLNKGLRIDKLHGISVDPSASQEDQKKAIVVVNKMGSMIKNQIGDIQKIKKSMLDNLESDVYKKYNK